MSRKRKELDETTLKGRFAKNLIILRKRAGLDYKAAAEKIGIPERTYESYESCDSTPPLNLWERIAATFGVSLKDLLPDTDKNLESVDSGCLALRLSEHLTQALVIAEQLQITINDILPKE